MCGGDRDGFEIPREDESSPSRREWDHIGKVLTLADTTTSTQSVGSAVMAGTTPRLKLPPISIHLSFKHAQGVRSTRLNVVAHVP